ncbi:MAG: LytTR family transcriptional regulator [Oscillospiraceae bacterium]|nr:LytTR family transcriptional regulator [Oscillospiraceae bacterium]
MNIRIIENIETALQVIIECRKADDEVMKLKNHIELFDNKLTARLEDKTFLINPTDTLYFESVDDRTFLYTADKVYEIRHRLYELEELLSDRDFIRISKSQIVNINCIKSLVPELNRSLSATLSNGEILTVSRRYVKPLRILLGI